MARKKERNENKICLTTLQTMFINSQEFALLQSKLQEKYFLKECTAGLRIGSETGRTFKVFIKFNF